jgi:hypothetical protein
MSQTVLPSRPATPTRSRRVRGPVLTLAGLAAATTAVALRDPHVQGSWGVCPSAALGVDCPGCGGMRAVFDLTHLRLAEAASSNLALVAALPVVVVLLVVWTVDRWRDVERGSSVLTMPLVTVAFVLLAVFTVLRNLPAFGWLAP